MFTKSAQLKRSSLSLSIAAAIAGMASGVVSVGAYAQAVPDQLEEVVVTGSRIVRRDTTSNSPIVTIEQDAFEAQAGLNFEAYLNQLPNYNPAATPTTTQGDVQITPVNSVGIASISLRGFGPNRSLVLVDGKRPVPINALMVTDINSIPSALIQRVETITGGASAVYGADAVGGVTNFILRDDFEGIEVDSSYSTSDEGGGEESRISAVFGSNFSDGRGNVALGVEHYDREQVNEIDRDAYTDRYADPNAAGTFIFLQGINHYNCLFNCPSAGAINGVFAARPAGTEVFNPTGPFFRQFDFNSNGSVFVQNSRAGLSKYLPATSDSIFPSAAFDASIPGNTQPMDGLKWHNSQALVSAPQERYSFFASGKYDFTDRITFNARATLAESETETLLFGTNAIFGWEGIVQYNPATDSPLSPTLNYNDAAVVAAAVANPTNAAYANPTFRPTGSAGAQHPVPVELAALLNSRPPTTFCMAGSFSAFGPCGAAFTGTTVTTDPLLVGTTGQGDWMPGWNPDSSLPPRSTVNTNTVWQVEGGLDFDLGADWTAELYFSHGQSSTYNNAAGNLSLTRYRDMIRRPDYGRGAAISGNTSATAQSPGFGAADVTCTSGFYNTFFAGDAALSQDCFNAVNATLQTRAQNRQDIIELNFEGAVAEWGAGELRLAAGYQGRDNSSTFVPDILQSTVSYTDQVVGVYPTGYMDASTSVDDLYLEALVPLLANRTGFQRLELELGGRWSDYEHADKEETYKALINWEINDWFRLRGGFNRATRAPNLGELFLNPQEIFQVGGNNFGDPCGLRSIAPYGAGGTGPDPILAATETQPALAAGQTAAGAQSARLICEAMMGPAATTQFYTVADATGGAGGLFNWVQQTGNPNLTSETADTWTFGFVMNSPFEAEWLSGMTLSFDYYKVEIEDAIMLYSVDYANFRCYGTTLVANAAEAAAQAASPGCMLLPRNPTLGGPLTTSISYDNQATIETAGADIALNWSFPLRNGNGLLFNTQATFLDYYETKQSPAVYDVLTDWAGSLGPNLSGTNPGAYDYRLFSSLGYFTSGWGVNLRWRYLPSVNTAEYASQQAIKANNASVAAGGPGITLSYTPLSQVETDSYSIFDLSFNWSLTEKFTLRGGITNLLDEEPVPVGSSTGFPVGTNLTAVCGGAPGCVAPTGFSAPVTGLYNGGYYDTIGRRYFMGFQVNF